MAVGGYLFPVKDVSTIMDEGDSLRVLNLLRSTIASSCHNNNSHKFNHGSGSNEVIRQ